MTELFEEVLKIRLADLQVKIRYYERELQDKKEELNRLGETTERTKKQLLDETNLLIIHKQKLLNQLKELSSTIPLIKAYTQGLFDNADKFEKERLTFLKGISSVLSKEMVEFGQKLTSKEIQLKEWEILLDEFVCYYTKLAEILELTEAEITNKKAELDKRAINISSSEEKVKEMLKIAEDKRTLTELSLKRAEERFKKADLMASKLEKDFEDEKKRLKKLADELSLKDKAVILERESLKVKERELRELNRLVGDKNRTLDRKARELKIMI